MMLESAPDAKAPRLFDTEAKQPRSEDKLLRLDGNSGVPETWMDEGLSVIEFLFPVLGYRGQRIHEV
jgi:hypothetical protein